MQPNTMELTPPEHVVCPKMAEIPVTLLWRSLTFLPSISYKKSLS